MPTNEERKEIAARLREYIDFDFETSNPWWYLMKSIYGDVLIHGDNELFSVLADLIEPSPRRTTPADKPLCEQCGYSIVYRDDDGEVCPFEYCPHCGAKVVEE